MDVLSSGGTSLKKFQIVLSKTHSHLSEEITWKKWERLKKKKHNRMSELIKFYAKKGHKKSQNVTSHKSIIISQRWGNEQIVTSLHSIDIRTVSS